MRAKGIYTMLSMDTYMRGVGGYHFGCMATCMAACGAKAAVEYCVRNMLFINGFTPPIGKCKGCEEQDKPCSVIYKKKTKRMLSITASVGHIVPDRRCCI